MNPVNAETTQGSGRLLKQAIEEIDPLENFLPQLEEREAREPIRGKRDIKTKRGRLK